MGTDKTRMSVSLTDAMVDGIAKYQAETKKRSQNAAIQSLIEIGMAEMLKGTHLDIDQSFANKYASLDDHGRRIVNLVLDEEFDRCVSHPDKSYAHETDDEYYGYRTIAANDDGVPPEIALREAKDALRKIHEKYGGGVKDKR